MDIKTIRSALIPAINTFCGVPIIEADQEGKKPDGPHAAFKITSPYIKGVGQAEEIPIQTETTYQLKRIESYKITISFTAFDKDLDGSLDLAQKIHDWFAFYGSDTLGANDIVVVNQTAVDNRDAFVIDGYERRNGFDVVLRVTRELVRDIDYIEHIDGITN